MDKGNIDTRTFSRNGEDTIKMDGWLSATLYNIGEADVIVMGVTVKKGESFVMGNATTKLYTEIKLKWNSDQDEECRCVVHYIQTLC